MTSSLLAIWEVVCASSKKISEISRKFKEEHCQTELPNCSSISPHPSFLDYTGFPFINHFIHNATSLLTISRTPSVEGTR